MGVLSIGNAGEHIVASFFQVIAHAFFLSVVTMLSYFRFNRGILTNVLEFLLVPGYTIDYYTIMAIPEAVRRSNKKNLSLQASTTCPTVNALHPEQQKSTPSHSNTSKEESSDKHL